MHEDEGQINKSKTTIKKTYQIYNRGVPLWLRVANYCLFGWPLIPKLDCVCKIF